MDLIKTLYILGNDIYKNYPLKLITSFRIGGTVPYFLIPKTENIFIETIKILKKNNINFKIIGNGTNIIAKDGNLNFWVISTKYLNQYEIINNNGLIYSQSGILLSQLIYSLAEKGFGGWEHLGGIPGTLGGAIYMNAGAYKGEIKEFIKKVKVLDINSLETLWIENKECNFKYRKSIFHNKKNWIILGAEIILNKDDSKNILNKIYEFNIKRFEKQPLEYPNAGSIFKRPEPNFYVGTTIDKLGLKGSKIGDIQISKKHAGFMINLGNGKYEDLKKLINKVKQIIKEKYGKDLEIEPEIWE